jgi:hypothetical protein
MTDHSGPQTVIPDQNMRFARVGSGAVVLDVKHGKYYNLNAIGATIWSALEKRQAVGAIVESLAAQYPAAEEQMEQDVQRFLAALKSKGLCS